MNMRLFSIRVKHELINSYINFYTQKAQPELEKAKGCHFAGLLESTEDSRRLISLTIWESPQNYMEYEQSKVYRNLLEENKLFLAESTELNYIPSEGSSEPVITTYDITSQTETSGEFPANTGKMNVRLLSLKINPDLLKEFEKIYINDVLPEIKEIKGLRYDFLTESVMDRSEVISITVWDSNEDLDKYIISGQFKKLLGKLEHTLLEIEENMYFIEDKYLMIIGKKFD